MMVALIGIIVIMNTGFAQQKCSFSLSGRVLDEHNGEPLAFANIYIKELNTGAVSDTTGQYRIDGLCGGTYTVLCSHLGCETLIKKVTVNGSTTFHFYPEHHAEWLKEMAIVGEAEVDVIPSVHKLEGKQLEAVQSLPLGEGLAQLNGVTTLSTGSSIVKPVIHGLHSNRILLLNNGIRQEGQQWGNEHAPEIDPFIAGELAVIKGAGSIRYGSDAIAGVILVEPNALRDSAGIGGRLHLNGSSNGRQGIASMVLDGNLEKVPALSWRVQGTLKRSGNTHSPDYYIKNTGLSESNFSWSTQYEKQDFGVRIYYSQFNTDIGIFTGAHIGNLTDLQRAFEAEAPIETADFSYAINRPRQHIEHELIKVNAHLRTWKPGTLRLIYARQYNKRMEYDQHRRSSSQTGEQELPALQFEITTHTAELIWEHIKWKQFKGAMGATGMLQGNTYEGRYFIPNFRKNNGGLFWTEKWLPDSSRWELEAGLRYDVTTQEVFRRKNGQVLNTPFLYHNASGSLGAKYNLTKRWSGQVNAGSAWRPPNVSELYSDGVHHGAAAVERGDTNLLPEQAYHLNTSIQFTGKKWSVYLEGYLNHIDRFIVLQPELPPTLTIRGAFPVFRYKQVDALLTGIDATLDYDWTARWNVTAKAALLRAFNQTTQRYLAQMPSDRFTGTVTYNFRDGKIRRSTYLSATVNHVAKAWRIDAEQDFAPPPPAYTLLHVQAGTTVYWGKQAFKLGVAVRNVLNTSYRDYMNRFRYYTDEMGTNVQLNITVPFEIIQTKKQ